MLFLPLQCSKLCQILVKLNPKIAKDYFKLCQSGGISPNMVILGPLFGCTNVWTGLKRHSSKKTIYGEEWS